MNLLDWAWDRLLQVFDAPVEAKLRAVLRRSMKAEAAQVESRAWLHAQDIAAINKIVQQAADAQLGLQSADQALVELTRARIKEIMLIRLEELERRTRGRDSQATESTEGNNGQP